MRLTFVITAFWLILMGTAGAGDVRAAIRESTAIPAQSLGAALQALAKDRDFQLICRADLVRGRRTNGISGQFTSSEALSELLRGTGLTYRYIDDRTVTIEAQALEGAGPTRASNDPPADRSSTTGTKEGKNSSSGRFRLAQGNRAADAAVAAITPAHAESSAGEEGLQEVVVTAQKYRQRAIDVPISMTVIAGSELRRLQVANLEDLQLYVPGMLVENNGTTMRVNIRGISNVFGQAALVGTYLDEADVTSEGFLGLDLNPYDVARVEVLKGPQGTLYGEGSVGGTIRYITNKPQLTEFQMMAGVTALIDEYGAAEDRVEAVLNVPIVSEVLGLRIAADLDEGGGWIDQPAANLKNINAKNLADVRIEGRWEPRSDLTVDAMEMIHREASGTYTGETQRGIYTQAFNLTTTPRLDDDYNISNVTVHWDPGRVSVVNSSTYYTHNNAFFNQGSSFQLTPPPSPKFYDYQPAANTFDTSLSDEFRVSGTGSGPLLWVIGGLYKRLDDEEPPAVAYFDVPGPPGSPLPPPITVWNDVNSNAWSVFGDANYRLLRRLALGAGVRYYKDEEDALIFGDSERERAEFMSIDPRFYARYEISRNMNVYASAAKGFRSGGFNGLGAPPFQPERVWTYELGTKMSFADGRIGADADVFFSNYAGYQIVGIPPQPNPPLDITRNAGTARIKGVEGDVAWSATSGWRVSLSGDYISARFVKVNVTNASYEAGDPLDQVPRYQLTASAEREFSYGGRPGYARLDYTQRARESYRIRDIGPWYYSQSDYMYLLSFRAGVSWSRSLEFGLFVQNLLNNRGYIGSDVIESYAARQEPRTFGVSFRLQVE